MSHNLWASLRESLILLHANYKSPVQLVLPRSLISAFVDRFLQILMAKLASCEISILEMALEASGRLI